MFSIDEVISVIALCISCEELSILFIISELLVEISEELLLDIVIIFELIFST